MESTPEVVNVYIQGNRLRILRRDVNGELVETHVRPEYALFVRKQDAHVLRPFENRRTIKDEGDFVRMICASYEERQKLVSGYKDGRIHKPGYFQEKNVETFEADLSPVKRWLIDSRARVQKAIPGYLDLENDSRVPFERKGEARMLCWGLCIPKADGTLEKIGGVLSEWSDVAEKELIKDLFFELCAVDQILAWNGDRFDFEYLKERIQRLGLDIDIRRWLLCDHMELFAKLNTGSESGDEKASMALDRVAAAQKVPGKLREKGTGPLEGVKVGGAKTYEFWAAGGRNRALLLEYCVEDAATMHRIEVKSGWVDVLAKISETCGVLADSRGFRGVNYVESFLMRLGAERGVRAPTKIFEENTWQEHEQFRGAHVFPTKKGLFRDVHICDFSRLYPSIIQAWNMSPETWLGAASRPDGSPATTLEEAVYDLAKGEAVAPITLQKFRVDGERGLLAHAVDLMVEQRKYWSKKKKACEPGTPEWIECNRKDQGWKALVNTLYGVIGSIFSRFFKKEIAESVTQTGVWLIKMVVEAARERHGLAAIAGDSITGDRIVVVKDPKGHVRMLPVQKLWEIVVAQKQERAAKEFKSGEGWMALAQGEICGWFPIEQVIRHRSGKKTWLITTKNGQTRVTTDHSIMVDGQEVKPEDFVSAGMRFTTIDALVEQPEERIDLWDYVCDYEDRYTNRSSEVVMRFECDGEWLKLVGHGSSTVRIRRFYRTGSVSYRALLRLIGIYVGDGSASTRATTMRYMLSFCKSDLPLMQQVKEDLETIATGMEVFGPHWSDTVYVVRSGTNAMACLFAALCGQKSRGKRLPSFAFALSSEDREVLVGALTSADGYVNKHGTLEYTSNSAELISGVSYVLSQHGMLQSWTYRDSKGAWRLRERTKDTKSYSVKAEVFESNGEEYVYDLSVTGAHTFVDGIGRVLLHNTDSGFLSKPGFSKDEFQAFINWCNSDLFRDAIIPTGGIREFISLSYEKEFALMISCEKKTYAGRQAHVDGKAVSDDKAPTIKGLEYKRGDSAKLARDMQEEIVRTILMIGRPLPKDDYPIEPKMLEEIIERWQQSILGGDFEFSEAVMAQKMTKNIDSYGGKKPDGSVLPVPGHVRVAKVLAERGFPIYPGVKVEYVVADGSVSPQKLLPAVDATIEDVDLFHLWESEVWPATERVVETCFPTHQWKRWGAVRPKKGVLAGQRGFGFGERTPLPKKKERKTILI